MSDRYRTQPRTRSPMRDPTRSSLQDFVSYGSHGTFSGVQALHAIPTRREVGTTPRGSADRNLLTPVVTTTYKVTPDLSRSSSLTTHHIGGRERRSTLDSGRPASIHVSSTAAPTRHRPSSPMQNTYRSSDEKYRSEIYSIPASSSSSHRHRHRPHYNATIDNSDVNKGTRESGSSLLRVDSGRHEAAYRSHRGTAARPQNLVRHPDSMADDYGDNGYGYTNARDVVQYDLSRSQPQHPESRRGSHDARPRPISIASPAEISSSRPYDSRGGPPPTSRGLDRIPRQPMYDTVPTIRAPSAERTGRSDMSFSDRNRRPVSLYQEVERPREQPRPREDRQTYRDTRDDDLRTRRDPPKSEKAARYDADNMTGRTDRNDLLNHDAYDARNDPDRREDRRDNRRDDRREDRRDDRKYRVDDHDDRHKERKDEKKSSGRDALVSLAGIAGAALGISGLAEAFGGEGERDKEREKSGDEREDRKYREDDERRMRDRKDDEDRPRRHATRNDREKERNSDVPREPRSKGIEPQESRAPRGKRNESDITPSSSGSNTPPPGEQTLRRVPRIAAAPAFNPKDTMDLRALKEALNRQDAMQEAVPISVSARTSKEPLGAHAIGMPSVDKETNHSAVPRFERKQRERGSTSTRNSFLPAEAAEPSSINDRTISIVDKPTISNEDMNKQPVRGILRQPKEKFPEEANPTREGVAPLKDAKKDGIPPNARWTKISRSMVNPEALELGKERFEARDDCVIVLRVLTKDEVQGYAEVTQKVRENREAEDHHRRRKERHERHARERRRHSDERAVDHDGTCEDRDPQRRHRNERSSHSESDTTEDEAPITKSRGVVFEDPKSRSARESVDLGKGERSQRDYL